MSERSKFSLMLLIFLAASYVPLASVRFQGAVFEAFWMIRDYARHHVIACLIPAFFIAGAISVFVSRDSVMRYFGSSANKILAYAVASISGTILAVCSCTVLPLFGGIYKRGAGIGPATAFLYSGPAINILAIILTARILGLKLGIARAVGAIGFSVIIGLIMAFVYRNEPRESGQDIFASEAAKDARSLWKNTAYFAVMVGILVFGAWSKSEQPVGFWNAIYKIHWWIAGSLLVALFWMLKRWFAKDEIRLWMGSTWIFAKQIFPLLLAGVFAAGLLMGRPGTDSGLIPNHYIEKLVGGNTLWANLFASVAGALMYFATLTEIPILQGLMGSGMGKGPALALLLAGPALSLPSMIVLARLIGARKTTLYVSLVVFMSAFAGMIYGALF